MPYYNEVPERTLNYRDNRDEAHLQVRKIVRRVQNKIDAYIGIELAKAELEGREVDLDLSLEGIKRLVVEVTVKEIGGGQIAALNS
jgi:hypothetical protein